MIDSRHMLRPVVGYEVLNDSPPFLNKKAVAYLKIKYLKRMSQQRYRREVGCKKYLDAIDLRMDRDQ